MQVSPDFTNDILDAFDQERLSLPPVIADAFPYGILITDTGLRVQQVNRWIRDAVAIPENYHNLPLEQVFPELAERNLLQAYELVLTSALPLTLSSRIHRYFIRIPVSEGDPLTFMPQATIISPLLSPNHEVLGTLTVITDVSERLEVERQLHQEVDKLNILLEIDRSLATLDLKACLTSIIDHSQEIFRADEVTLYLYEQGELRKARIDSGKLGEGENTGLADWTAIHKESALALDIQLDDRCHLRQSWQRSEMTAPLMVENQCIGVLDVQSKKPYNYHSDDLSLLEAFASRAAVAIHNARAHADERRQRKLAEVLRDVGIALTSTLSQEKVLDILLSHIGSLVLFDRACVFLFDGDRLHLANHTGYEPSYLSRMANWGEDENFKKIAAQIAHSHQPVILQDSDPLPIFQSYENYPSHSWVGIPILVRNRILGIFTVEKNEAHFYHTENVDLLAVFASYAAIALENAQLYDQQQKLAVTDSLTGLANRRKFDEVLHHELKRSSRYSHITALIMIDVDDFKRYNDTYGHLAGDALLKRLSDLLRLNIRGVDTAARFGGEEFCIILPETDAAQAVLVAERIRQAVAALHLQTNHNEEALLCPIGISLGVAVADGRTISAEQLIAQADEALYQAKKAGKNRTVLWKGTASL